MSFAIINDRAALSDYLQEVFSTWGLPLCRPIAVADVDALEPVTTPVLILPAGSDVDAAAEFAARGGIVVTMLPQGAVAAAVLGCAAGGAGDFPQQCGAGYHHGGDQRLRHGH